MTKLTALDLHPLYRNAIGVDRLFDRLINNVETAQSNYPPYNIIQDSEDNYTIEIAVAGFGMDELTITQDQNTLTVKGEVAEEVSANFLHKGIAGRNFTREFTLADHVEVVDASLDKGILIINLKRELPEAMKPKTIAIGHVSE